MSIRIMTQVWDNADEWLTGSRRLVLLALADNANDGGVCWPSINTIAAKVNLSRRYTIDILNELEEKKYIERDQEQRSSTVYTLMVASEARLTTSSEAGRTTLVRPASPEPPINPQENPKTPAAQKPAAERSPFVIAMENLELTFSQARRTKLPDWKADPKMCNKRWRTPLKEMWDLCGQDTDKTGVLIQESVSHMLKDNLTFDAPDQILKVARSLVIDMDNGTHRTTAPEPIAQTMARMGKEYREHVAMKAKLGYAEDEPL